MSNGWYWAWGVIELAIWSWYLGNAAVGSLNLPNLLRDEWAIDAETWNSLPRLTVVVPACNEEAGIEACLRSLVRSLYPNLRVVAVNDRSTDSTGSIMDRLQAEFPTRLHVIHLTELPEGWLGKTRAMWVGARQEPSSDYILFTDGDVVFAPKALAHAMKYAVTSEADHLVLFPTLVLKGVGETMMIALFQTLFIFEHRAWKAVDPKSKDYIGVGAFNLVRRHAYEAIGTYAALRLAILDDMKLGERIKRGGFKQRVAYGRDLIRIRWLQGMFGVIRGLTKNGFAVADFRLTMLLFQITGMVYILLGPYVGALLAPEHAKIPFLVTIALIWSQYIGLAFQNRMSPLYMVTHPFAAMGFIYTLLRSMIVTLVNGGIEWRGTRYSLSEIRAVQNT